MRYRTALITGASSGIGEEMALQLAAQGYSLSLVARREHLLEAVAERAWDIAQEQGHDVTILSHIADVSSRQAAHDLVKESEAMLDGIDLLILNAGIGESQDVHHFDDSVAARTIEVNVNANIYLIGAALPAMLQCRKGHIVGMSSLAAYRGLPGSAAYCASKAAFSTLLESLRADLRSAGIHVTTVSPGFIRTPMTSRNSQKMPCLMPVDKAVQLILRGIHRKKSEIRFPWRLATAIRLARLLPDSIYQFLASRYKRPPKKNA